MTTTSPDTLPNRSHYNVVGTDTVVEREPTTFARVRFYKKRDMFYDYDDPPRIVNNVYEVVDIQNGSIQSFTSEEELAEFRALDVGPREYVKYKSVEAAIRQACDAFPTGELRNAIVAAVMAQNTRYLEAVREVRLGQRTDLMLEDLFKGMRDLEFTFSSLAKALALGSDEIIADHATHAWRTNGKRTQRRGYNAQYEVCNDLFHDEGDDPLTSAGEPEIHYPGSLDIRVDPTARLEIIYTPKLDSARQAHRSQAVVSHDDGRVQNFDNEALSIRLDLDPNAPVGLSLDIARSPYIGAKDGRTIERSGDLVGNILNKISLNGNHEYEGFTHEMLEEFVPFCDTLSLQLALQGEELKRASVRRTISGVALRVAA